MDGVDTHQQPPCVLSQAAWGLLAAVQLMSKVADVGKDSEECAGVTHGFMHAAAQQDISISPTMRVMPLLITIPRTMPELGSCISISIDGGDWKGTACFIGRSDAPDALHSNPGGANDGAANLVTRNLPGHFIVSEVFPDV